MGDYLTPIVLPTSITAIKQIVSGANWFGIITPDGKLYLWGQNSSGQLGFSHLNDIGDNLNEMGNFLEPTNLGTGLKIMESQGGANHHCVLFDNLRIKCWGYNAYGNLGYEDNTIRGDQDSEMGDYLAFVDLGVNRFVQSLYVGYHHSCAFLNDDSLKCWGRNQEGQAGQGHGSNIGVTSSTMGDNLDPINLGSGVSMIECLDYSPTINPTFDPTLTHAPSLYSEERCSSQIANYQHNCILTSTFQVKCFGKGSKGQLGYGDRETRGDGGGEMGNYLPMINVDENVISIQTGYHHTCAQLSNLDVRCWGWNTRGQLGQWELNNTGDDPGEMGSYLSSINFGTDVVVSKLIVGSQHNLIITDDQRIKAWGYGPNGRV